MKAALSACAGRQLHRFGGVCKLRVTEQEVVHYGEAKERDDT